MPTPSAYGALHEEYGYLRAMAFKYLMSSEVPNIDGPLAGILFDMVGDQSEAEVEQAIREYKATL